jgi:hypothetical protein
MPTWLFALVVLGIGLGLAFFVDRMMARPGSVAGDTPSRRERSKWLYYWFMGRFPEKDEPEKDEPGNNERAGRGGRKDRK